MDYPAFDILYRDDHYIAINKPPGFLVHRSQIDFHETTFVLQLLRDQIGQRVYPVHRLDKPTSGALVFALSEEAMVKLMSEFENGEVSKRYEAIVRGFTPDTALIERALRKIDPKNGKKKLADTQDAITEFVTLERFESGFPVGKFQQARFSHIELAPKTGRRHQIRRHLAGIAHPIIGDTRYGDGKQNKAFRSNLEAHRLMLAATEIRFSHPFSAKSVKISAPIWADFRNVLELAGK